MTKPYVKTWHLKADIDLVKEVIVNNKEQFFCPFSNIESYLNIYEGRDCAVQFLICSHAITLKKLFVMVLNI